MRVEQITTLLACIRHYLNYLWTMVAPSPERNNAVRILQSLKGKLLLLLEQPGDAIPVTLNAEEVWMIRRMLDELLRYPTRFPGFGAQEKVIDLTTLKKQIEQTYGF